MSCIDVYAGETARKLIAEHGFTPNLFKGMIAASGGPKWFVLYGLDKVLLSDFFASKTIPSYNIGTSSGAWRTACMAIKQPGEALNRLVEGYANTTYTDKPSVSEISDKARTLLSSMLGETGIDDIVNNRLIKTHTIVNRCKGLTASTNRFLQLVGLLPAAALNRIDRATLKLFFERITISNDALETHFALDDGFGDTLVSYTQQNAFDVLMATGAIPLILEGVKDIEGAPHGMYRDGGIIDYHFDLDFTKHIGTQNADENQLMIYPHFYPHCSPGWFDKRIAGRKGDEKRFSNVVLISPSRSFVDTLPYQKIPDRTDFEKMDDTTRMAYWHEVIERSHELGEAFKKLLDSDDVNGAIKPIFR
ncbi:hypothetical protein [Thalassotalea agarivorans]|uniref:Patatin-like phospholipase n=1 Tax=Thalassotalea agarivorans TaxID=349064 RepID=A0A1I0FHS0_THASX|nr:hypothetical protein [Thalassotalea agarivorans]SET57534.1 hypothetical protein SAMN05660429_02133 [Thalassotalea agarivorans]